MTQHRWFCHACGREWVRARVWDAAADDGVWWDAASNTCPHPDCEAIGFLEPRTFEGLFDSTTPPEVTARIYAKAGGQQVAAEDAARARLQARVEATAPAQVLCEASV